MFENLLPESLFPKVRADMKRYESTGGWARNLGFWITATYRLGHWSHGVQNRPARLALLAVARVSATPWRFLKNVSIPSRARIGGGLCLEHAQNVIIPPDAEIGDGVTLFHDVTLGLGPEPGVPRVGNGVVVFAGAKLLGGVTIGDKVEVGPNAVVTRDVEEGCIVSNAPPRVLSRETVNKVRAVTRGTVTVAPAVSVVR
jgi:serine O-acetyltransferase